MTGILLFQVYENSLLIYGKSCQRGRESRRFDVKRNREKEPTIRRIQRLLWYANEMDGMYYIRKSAEKWAVHNNHNGKSRPLNDQEIQLILNEFPNLRTDTLSSRSMTYFRNNIKSISDLP